MKNECNKNQFMFTFFFFRYFFPTYENDQFLMYLDDGEGEDTDMDGAEVPNITVVNKTILN